MAISVGASGSGGRSSVFGRRRFGGHAPLAEMNVVPLVDVVLVMLIIFMLTAHVMEFGLEIKVPEVKQSRDTVEDFPVIGVKSDGRLYLNETPVKNINLMADEIRKRFKGAKSVFVAADEGVLWGPLAQVISALNDAKLDIKMVAKPEEGNR